MKNKTKNLSSNLQAGSTNQRILSAIIKTARAIGKGLAVIDDAYGYIFGGFDMTSVYQKFYGTYYSDKLADERIKKEKKIKEAIKDLERMKYIKLDRNNKKIYLINKGALEVLRFEMKKERSKWDKKWRIVMFDIPEKRRQQRDFLRQKLKWLGFKELHKSVWVFPYDIRRQIRDLIKICNFASEGDIRFLTVEDIEDDKDLKKEFDL